MALGFVSSLLWLQGILAKLLDLLWHIDSDLNRNAESEKLRRDVIPGVSFKDMDICISGTDRFIEVIRDRTEGEWQGVISTAKEQGLYRPVNCVSAVFHGGSLRVVTVLNPHVNKENRIIRVKASEDPRNGEISIYLTDGTVILYHEEVLKNRID